jgi:predicted RNA-binding Zn-ribbon protein involved in translation (DUF1610 family)
MQIHKERERANWLHQRGQGLLPCVGVVSYCKVSGVEVSCNRWCWECRLTVPVSYSSSFCPHCGKESIRNMERSRALRDYMQCSKTEKDSLSILKANKKFAITTVEQTPYCPIGLGNMLEF